MYFYCETDFVTELCPNCTNEVTVRWDTAQDGFAAYCPFCGKKIMLCSECQETENSCDWTEENGCKMGKQEGSSCQEDIFG